MTAIPPEVKKILEQALQAANKPELRQPLLRLLSKTLEGQEVDRAAVEAIFGPDDWSDSPIIEALASWVGKLTGDDKVAVAVVLRSFKFIRQAIWDVVHGREEAPRWLKQALLDLVKDIQKVRDLFSRPGGYYRCPRCGMFYVDYQKTTALNPPLVEWLCKVCGYFWDSYDDRSSM